MYWFDSTKWRKESIRGSTHSLKKSAGKYVQEISSYLTIEKLKQLTLRKSYEVE